MCVHVCCEGLCFHIKSNIRSAIDITSESDACILGWYKRILQTFIKPDKE